MVSGTHGPMRIGQRLYAWKEITKLGEVLGMEGNETKPLSMEGNKQTGRSFGHVREQTNKLGVG